MFVISWRNPDARHADWGFDTYVRAISEALDAANRICGIDRAALFGVLLGRDPVDADRRVPGRDR